MRSPFRAVVGGRLWFAAPDASDPAAQCLTRFESKRFADDLGLGLVEVSPRPLDAGHGNRLVAAEIAARFATRNEIGQFLKEEEQQVSRLPALELASPARRYVSYQPQSKLLEIQPLFVSLRSTRTHRPRFSSVRNNSPYSALPMTPY